jgi:hypothetical protein
MRPGTVVEISQSVPAIVAPTDTGVMFVGGVTSRGPTEQAVLCRSIDEVTRRFGPRIPEGETVPTSGLWDACDVLFKTGCTKIYVGRFAGPDAEPATVTLNDDAATPAPSIAVDSNGPGPSTLTVEVQAGAEAGTFRIIVVDTDTEKVVDLSPPLASPTDAVQWARFSKPNLIRIRALGSNNPDVVAATPLAGGTDDADNITDATRIAQLPTLFPKSLGPGQMAVPGATTAVMQAGLSDYCATVQNRVALLDGPDTSNAQTVVTAVEAWQAACEVPLSETYGIFSAPWRVVPGADGSFSRVVPPSAIIGGLIAASDARTGNPNLPAAGDNGIDSYSLGSSQAEWSDEDLESLNESGVACFRNVYGGQRLYGYRSGALSSDISAASAAWQSFGASRLRMALTNELNIIGEQFLFDQLDGKGLTIAEFNGAISGKLLQYWQLGALYGSSASEAFVVDTGPTVNTPETIEAKELHSKIGIKISPFNELSFFEVTSVALSEVLAA